MAQKHADFADPDPQHCFKLSLPVLWVFLKGVKNFVFSPRSPELRFVVPIDLRQRTARPDDTAGDDGIISTVKRGRTIMKKVASGAKQNGDNYE
jgi:hypothetical protein